MMAVAWPPDYLAVIRWRNDQLLAFEREPWLVLGAREYYKTRPAEFISHWCVTVDPRNALTGRPVKMPFVLFPRQVEFVEFLHACLRAQECGLIEKSRDMGATWLCCAFSVWLWLFHPGASVGWGSRKADLVDTLGDPDSIFEKIRVLVRALPPEFLPARFVHADHMTYMKVVNTETRASITGESGDNIGRGGRKLAQPLDAKILTPHGWQLMADMRVGSSVIGRDGQPHTVVNVVDHGVRDVYRVTFSDNTWTECCGDHLWQVTTSANRKVSGRKIDRIASWWHRKWRPRGVEHQVLSTDEILEQIAVTEVKYRVPMCSSIELRLRPVPLDPYVLGVLLGDGSVRHLDKSSPTLCAYDEEIVQGVRDNLPLGVILKTTGRTGVYTLGDERGRTGRGVRSRAKLVIMETGIAGHGAYDKSVPDLYKFNSKETRLAVLQGLLDTDGSVHHTGRARFTSMSRQLCNDAQFLVQSLGGTASYSSRRIVGYGISHQLYITLPAGVPPFRLSRKLGKTTERRPRRDISSITFSGRKPVRCISVDAPDNLYLTDHCIVTHNCYFVDEAAHLEHPESVEGALTDNTRVRFDISSVGAPNNIFHRKREAGVEWSPGDVVLERGKTQVFVMDWRDHPDKSVAWYNTRRAKAEDEGLLHLFAQEVDRDYSATISGTIIPLAWIKSSVDAHLLLPRYGEWFAGGHSAALDVADEGGDRNALCISEGVVITHLDEWGERDTGATARRAIEACHRFAPITIQYDCIGVGAGVKAEANRLRDERDSEGRPLLRGVTLAPWNAGASPLLPDARVVKGDVKSPLNKDFYGNLKAQGWWNLRWRFERTHKLVMAHHARTPLPKYDVRTLISLSSRLKRRASLEKELNQVVRKAPTGKMKLMIDKTPEGMKSPNLADAVMMDMWPVATYDTSNRWVA